MSKTGLCSQSQCDADLASTGPARRRSGSSVASSCSACAHATAPCTRSNCSLNRDAYVAPSSTASLPAFRSFRRRSRCRTSTLQNHAGQGRGRKERLKNGIPIQTKYMILVLAAYHFGRWDPSRFNSSQTRLFHRRDRPKQASLQSTASVLRH